MLGIEFGRALRDLEIEREPLLNTRHADSLGEIEKQDQIEAQRRGQNAVTAQKVYLDLHRIAEPAENVDIVPALFVVTARRIVVNANLMMKVLVQFGIDVGLKDMV